MFIYFLPNKINALAYKIQMDFEIRFNIKECDWKYKKLILS